MDTLISILQSWSVVLFGSIFFKSLETLNAKVVSFLNVYYKRSNQKAILTRGEQLKTWKTIKGVFRYSGARPPKARDPGHLPGLPNV